MGQVITFRKYGKVTLGEEIGAGLSRTVYKCDYVDDKGRTYVVKEAQNSNGRLCNAMEYRVFQQTLGTAANHELPLFLSHARGYNYLLVEECITAQHNCECGMPEEGCYCHDDPYDKFSEIPLFDMHGGNWGYTLFDNRAVILDLAYGEGDSAELMEWIGVSQRNIDTILTKYGRAA